MNTNLENRGLSQSLVAAVRVGLPVLAFAALGIAWIVESNFFEGLIWLSGAIAVGVIAYEQHKNKRSLLFGGNVVLDSAGMVYVASYCTVPEASKLWLLAVAYFLVDMFLPSEAKQGFRYFKKEEPKPDSTAWTNCITAIAAIVAILLSAVFVAKNTDGAYAVAYGVAVIYPLFWLCRFVVRRDYRSEKHCSRVKNDFGTWCLLVVAIWFSDIYDSEAALTVLNPCVLAVAVLVCGGMVSAFAMRSVVRDTIGFFKTEKDIGADMGKAQKNADETITKLNKELSE